MAVRAEGPAGVLLRGPAGARFEASASELAALPQTSVDLTLSGKTIHYEGVRLDVLLAKVAAPLGRALRGAAMADLVVVKGADGYKAVFGLADMDPAFRNEPVILADRADGAPLGPEGPLRLVVGGDLRPARSVRSVVEIDVEPLP